MEDKSLFNQTGGVADYEYINECIKEVCTKGDSLSKYQKLIEKKFDADFYQKCNNFVEEVKRSVERKKFTNTSVVNLKYLANEIHIPDETVDMLVGHFSKRFAQAEEPLINQPDPQPARSPQPQVMQKQSAEEPHRKLWPWVVGIALAVMAILLVIYVIINNNERRENDEWQARYEQELADERRENEEQQLAEQKRQQEANAAAEEEQREAEMEIKGRLREYFSYLDNKRYEDLKDLFAPTVDRFQNARNISSETVIQTIIHDDEASGILSKNSMPRWNTLKVRKFSNGGYYVELEEDFEIDRVDRNKFTKFVLKNEIEFDQYYNITSIYQNTIERH